tara:strand:+ start:98 stop:487 length:390 start_codon:yes stop_codon:yes gene_type:complete
MNALPLLPGLCKNDLRPAATKEVLKLDEFFKPCLRNLVYDFGLSYYNQVRNPKGRRVKKSAIRTFVEGIDVTRQDGAWKFQNVQRFVEKLTSLPVFQQFTRVENAPKDLLNIDQFPGLQKALLDYLRLC